MTSAQVVETSVNVTPNSPSQDYSHPDDHNLRTYDITPGFKPFTVIVPFKPNTAKRDIETFVFFGEIRPCTNNIVYARFEVLRTFLCVL